MKKISLIFITLFSLSAFGLNEGLTNLDLLKISADKDIQLSALKDYFRQERENAEAVMSDTEGMIAAAAINLIADKMRAVENVLFADSNITEEDLRQIDFSAMQVQLDEIKSLIDELNISL